MNNQIRQCLWMIQPPQEVQKKSKGVYGTALVWKQKINLIKYGLEKTKYMILKIGIEKQEVTEKVKGGVILKVEKHR